MFLRLRQPSNASFPTDIIELGKVTVINFPQKRKALSRMSVTESEIDMLVKLQHPSNAAVPIVAAEFGSVTAVKLVHR